MLHKRMADIRIRVRGDVDLIFDDIGDLTLWLRDAGYSEYCHFDERHRSAVTSLREGQQVTVDGTFNGYWPRDCESWEQSKFRRGICSPVRR